MRPIFIDLNVLVDLSDLRRASFLETFNSQSGLPALTLAAWSPMSSTKLEGLPVAAQLAVLRAEHPGLALDAAAFEAALQARLVSGAAALVAPPALCSTLQWLAPQASGLTLTATEPAALVQAVLAALALPPGLLQWGGAQPPPAPPAGALALQPASLATGASGSAEALAAAGVELVTVLDALDFTPAFLSRALAGRGAVAPLIPRLRIVVPMAGLGSRFTQEGFSIQKPFLPTIEGLQLWEAVVENLMPKEEPLRSATEVHVVVRADQVHLFKPPPHITMHTVAALTEGPACTVLSVQELINDDVPLMIGNSDQFLEWDSDAFYAAAFHPDFDGAISTFFHPRPDDLKWSYAALHPASGAVQHVAEKVYVGPYATTGLYAWRRGSDFVRHALAMIAANTRVNNEFYVCPVYNSAIAAGLRYRTVNCARFWGVGVPVDYASWLDKYTPPGAPTAFQAALARRYAAVWCKWASRVPAPMPGFTADPTLCACMWATGAFHLGPALRELREALAPWAAKCEWFEPEKGLGLGAAPALTYAAAAARPKAVLHHTFFQFHTFPVDPAAAEPSSSSSATASMLPSLSAWAAAAQGAMAALPPYYLTLTGVSPVRSGLVACGYPPRDYAPVRAAIRGAAPCKEPHAQDIHHVTLLRWTAPLTPEENNAVAGVLARFRHTPLGLFQPSQWHVGLATWHVRPESCRPVHSWRAPPSPWVLHRGNTAGLAPASENVPALLQARLQEGWDVEVDLWRCTPTEALALCRAAAASGHCAGVEGALASLAERVEGAGAGGAAKDRPALFLGHDAPVHALEREEEGPGGLLGAPGVWIHCKNLAAWEHLRRHERAASYNYFVHDKDQLALTSQGMAWGYPEVPVPGPGAVSVVWPHKKEHEVRPGVGVCWDYLPQDVQLKY